MAGIKHMSFMKQVNNIFSFTEVYEFLKKTKEVAHRSQARSSKQAN